MDDFFDEDNNQQQPTSFDENDFNNEEEQQQEPVDDTTAADAFDQETQPEEEEQTGFDDNQQQEEQQQGGFEDSYNESATYVPPQVEQSTPLQEWQRQKNQSIQESEDKEDQKQKDIRKAAQAYKQSVLEERSDRISQKSKQNKSDEESFVSTNKVDHDNVWENVLKYVDIHGGPKRAKKQKLDEEEDLDEITGKRQKPVVEEVEEEIKDVSRMKTILLQLKNNPLPAAAN